MDGANKLFDDIRRELLKFDPVAFCEYYLKVDGRPLKLSGNGWRFLSDIYRYVAVKALDRDKGAKPVVCLKARQTGASTMATALEMYFCTSGLFGTKDRPPIRILHCFPTLNNVQKFSKDKLNTMMRTSTDNYIYKKSLSYDPERDKRRHDVPDDTLYEKFFQNENKLWVDSNGGDASRMQGMTLDGIFHDEVQRMLKDDINNGIRTLTASNYGPVGKGIQLYFGTPLSKGSYFWKIWQASDQRYYHLGCLNDQCKEYFILYTPGSDDWERIWLHDNIVKCPKCGFEQDKVMAVENGKWIPTRHILENGEEPLYVGFHFNQFLLPYMTKEAIQTENPKYNPTKSERIWQTDILGEFYSGSALPMTEEEIFNYCKNPDRRPSGGMDPKSHRATFMGIDWGGKDDDEDATGGQSFSSVVVISAGSDGTLQIETAFKLKKNDFEFKKSVVHEMFRRFNIKIAVADQGFGNDIVPALQKEYQSRLWGCINSSSLLNPVKIVPDNITMICNRDLILDDIFNMMRKGKILFPLADFESHEKMRWLIEHCCSMERKTRTVAGNIVNQYVKGATPNDGLMALMYAILAWRFDITRGFKTKEHQVGKSKGPILAHIPRRL